MAGKKAAPKSRKPAASHRAGGHKSAASTRPPVRKAAAERKSAAAPRPAASARSVAAAKTPVAVERPKPRPLAPPQAPVRLPRPTTHHANDDAEAGSLLAGPRNVKPYVAKRGERYMSKEQLTHFQHILTSWKRDLMMEVDRTVTHMKDEAANFPDPNDRATQEEEFSLELRTRDRERKLIRKIDEALKRTEDGSYGYCLETGEEIGIKRLEARPVATLTIEAQERRERRERQYGERDDRYR
jgi:DnaK suppressor protein